MILIIVSLEHWRHVTKWKEKNIAIFTKRRAENAPKKVCIENIEIQLLLWAHHWKETNSYIQYIVESSHTN